MPALVPILLLALWLPSHIKAPGWTRFELREDETGSKLLSLVLRDGEPITLTWRNSLFGLDVTEVFVAQSGLIIQTEVTFADPRGFTPPRVSPQDIDDLYHTGGPFSAKGLDRPFTRIVYRVGEIGNPAMRVRDDRVDFKREVGFGNRVVLEAESVNLYESLPAWAVMLYNGEHERGELPPKTRITPPCIDIVVQEADKHDHHSPHSHRRHHPREIRDLGQEGEEHRDSGRRVVSFSSGHGRHGDSNRKRQRPPYSLPKDAENEQTNQSRENVSQDHVARLSHWNSRSADDQAARGAERDQEAWDNLEVRGECIKHGDSNCSPQPHD